VVNTNTALSFLPSFKFSKVREKGHDGAHMSFDTGCGKAISRAKELI
jgi:hypothetical protein